MRNQANPIGSALYKPAGTNGFTKVKQLPFGGAGFVVCQDQSADGTDMMIGGDVIGPQQRNGSVSTWSNCLTQASIGSAFPLPRYNTAGSAGTCAVKIAPSNKNVRYCNAYGVTWRSADRGVTWTVCTGVGLNGEVWANSNVNDSRLANDMIAVHPTDANKVLFGSEYSAAQTTMTGPWWSDDGGTTSTKITGLPATVTLGNGGSARYLVAIDQGNANYCYIFVDGVGLYASTAGHHGPYSAVSGSPTRCSQMLVDVNGTVWIGCGGPFGNPSPDIYRRTRAGVATNITTGQGDGVAKIAVMPSNPQVILAVSVYASFWMSWDGGSTWSSFGPVTNDPNGEVGHIVRGSHGLLPSMVRFDTQIANRCWIMWGFGVGYLTVPTSTASALVYTDKSAGNEELKFRTGLSIPGQPYPLFGALDIPVVRIETRDNYAKNYSWMPSWSPDFGKLANGFGFDYAQDNLNFVAAAIGKFDGLSGYSVDGGRTFTRFPNQTGFLEATAVAVNRQNQIILLEGNGFSGKGHYSQDGGQTWANIKLDGTNDTTGWNRTAATRKKNVTADKTRSNVFAVHRTSSIDGNSVGDPLGGVWVTLNGGEAWTHTVTGPVGSSVSGYYPDSDNANYYDCRLEYIPGFTGEMLFTSFGGYPNDRLWWLTNDGANLARLGRINRPTCFDFGPPAPGQTRPSLWVEGELDGVSGLYFSADWFATDPVLVDRSPYENTLSLFGWIIADRNQFGVCYCLESGVTYYQNGPRLRVKAA